MHQCLLIHTVHGVCIQCRFHTYRHQCVYYMHECIKSMSLLLRGMYVQYVWSEKERKCSICALNWPLRWVWAGRGVSGCIWGRVEGGRCWALFWRIAISPGCLRSWAWVSHTLLWVNILTSGESHPLPAEHWPTDGAEGGSRQKKERHVQMKFADVELRGTE